MIAAALLENVMQHVARRANDLSDVLASHLRASFPGVHFSVCNDDDLPPRIAPAAGNAYCRLYYVDSAEHCLRLTTDAELATGLVVGIRDWDE